MYKTTNQLPKFRIKILVEIIDIEKGVYGAYKEIKFKNLMLQSILWDYTDVYILTKGTISVANTAAADADGNNTNIKEIFKKCAPLRKCITEINDAKVDNVKDIDVVMKNAISNLAITIQKHKDFDFNIAEMNQLQTNLMLVLVLLIYLYLILK